MRDLQHIATMNPYDNADQGEHFHKQSILRCGLSICYCEKEHYTQTANAFTT